LEEHHPGKVPKDILEKFHGKSKAKISADTTLDSFVEKGGKSNNTQKVRSK